VNESDVELVVGQTSHWLEFWEAEDPPEDEDSCGLNWSLADSFGWTWFCLVVGGSVEFRNENYRKPRIPGWNKQIDRYVWLIFRFPKEGGDLVKRPTVSRSS
jgi:hypothetical protein